MRPSHTTRSPDNPDLPDAVLSEMRDVFIRLHDASSLAQMVSVVLTGVRALGRVVLHVRREQRDLPYRQRCFHVPCPCCKHPMTKSRGKPKRKRRYTIVGPIWYRRCQYRCPRCTHRIFPLDESLKLAKALRGHGERFGKTVVLLCTLMPFGNGAELFSKLHGFGISSQLARALTLTIGLNMVKSEMARAKALWEKRYNDPELFEPPPAKLRRIQRHRRVYVMMDNSKIGIQEGARGRGAEARNMLRAEGKVSNVLQRLRKIKKASDTARTEIEHAMDYIEKHRRRMHYRDFRNRGLLIGSGAIESIHAWVIQPRCRLPGMRWTVKGANAIIRLRCSWASDRWDEDFAQAANGDALSNRNLKVAVGETDP